MIRALIFDCDGVIADSEPVHLQAFQEALRAEDVTLETSDYYRDYLGFDDYGVLRTALESAGRSPEDGVLERLAQRKAARYAELFDRSIKILPGVVDLVRSARERVPLAIYSCALRHEVEQIARKAGILECFSSILTAEDVVNGKPDPEGYLMTISRLSNLIDGSPLKPSEAAIIEDSIPGIQAARSAGAKVLAMTSSHPREELSDADGVVDTLEGITLDRLEKLVGG
jgi:HAD superfamily hydrolase (TIGR01509 family)